ncbi:unnamed protein product [Hymenolepis diminuta]|uniref:Short chain dehydrogenase n=1 Tax=Hymenolepis diminuta TaxID=6216 RepID=A0A0R3SNJ2_HYMDI|nr:unnamed protein product [Hymenolepis diminuta]
MGESQYSRLQCYCQSKLAISINANYLTNRLGSDGIRAASVHPGVAKTELDRYNKFAKVGDQPDFALLLEATLPFFRM